ncbi:MAG: polyketide cyclase [Rhizobiales bacterium]|nr:polyketide cyclase [Hyphomicrobiales bacterium]MBA68710.1 polyketide cyclase [Hyphomicrobiales bacterium]|tara:strand:+ start:880 stop:1350 length:471 start_codon:yes stop_codon:yes gene_type:complete
MSTDFPKDRELVLDRLIDAPRDAVWRCWTEPELLVQWFTPAPWSTKSSDIDLRPGGRFNTVMVDPDGNPHPNKGSYLEVVPGERLVFTDAMTEGFEPSENPFIVATLSFSDEGKATRYRAVVRHFSEEAKKKHEDMGFHSGWNAAADQLEALAKRL